MASLLSELVARLEEKVHDTGRLAAAHRVAAAVANTVDKPGTTADTVSEAAIQAVGDALERAEFAVQEAEKDLGMESN